MQLSGKQPYNFRFMKKAITRTKIVKKKINKKRFQSIKFYNLLNVEYARSGAQYEQETNGIGNTLNTFHSLVDFHCITKTYLT